MVENNRKDAKDSMEEIILQTAEDMFLSNGYNGVSTTDIAKRVGCNQALIHYYYRTKSNLFTKVLERKTVSVIKMIKLRFDDGISFEEKITGIVDLHIEFLRENPRLPLFFLEEARNNDEAISIIKRAFFDYKDELIDSLQESLDKEAAVGNIAQMDAFDLAMDIVSLNIFPFLVDPIIKNVLKMDTAAYDTYLDGRKKEIVKLIKCRLKMTDRRR